VWGDREDVGGSYKNGNDPMRGRWVFSIDDDACCHPLGRGHGVGRPHHLFCAGQICSGSNPSRACAYKSRRQNQRDGSQDSVSLPQFNHWPAARHLVTINRRKYSESSLGRANHSICHSFFNADCLSC